MNGTRFLNFYGLYFELGIVIFRTQFLIGLLPYLGMRLFPTRNKCVECSVLNLIVLRKFCFRHISVLFSPQLLIDPIFARAIEHLCRVQFYEPFVEFIWWRLQHPNRVLPVQLVSVHHHRRDLHHPTLRQLCTHSTRELP